MTSNKIKESIQCRLNAGKEKNCTYGRMQKLAFFTHEFESERKY